MFDIIALIFITREIGRIAESKGQPPFRWKMYSILGWVSFELIGIVVGLFFFNQNEIFPLLIVGLIFAFTSYVIIKNVLNKLPDQPDDDEINEIGKYN
ncbi:MAG: hypothetical protein ABI266_10210 [Ginsengibacter sp.]